MRLQLLRPSWSHASVSGYIEHSLRGPGGAVANVLEYDDRVVLRQDLVRSFPLFYSRSASTGELLVSDDVRVLVDAQGVSGYTSPSAEEFRQLGFVTGAATLHPRISQVQAGEEIELFHGGSAQRSSMRLLGADAEQIQDDDAEEVFSTALEEVFSRLLSSLNGRQIVVPLSGGLDSRLIAVILRDLGYDNVVNFTYGAGETPESRVSRAVASAVDQEWIFVPYDASRIRRAWAQEGAAFVEYAYAGASLPHIQDWYALRHLRANDLIAPDAVFLPGHTVVGNMHDDDVLDRPGDVPAADVRDLIIRHHGVLQPNGPAALHRVPGFTARIDQYLRDCGYDGSPLARLVAIEGWNLHERQAKYINNSMRAYEHFGYDWALPMLEEPVVRAWERFSTRIRRDRAWYAGVVDRRYARATRSQLSTYSPTSLSGGTRTRLKSLLRAAGLLTLAERTAAARSYSHHAMAFQAFIDEGAESELRRIIMKGGNPLGTYADRFLEDAWAPGQRVFD